MNRPLVAGGMHHQQQQQQPGMVGVGAMMGYSQQQQAGSWIVQQGMYVSSKRYGGWVGGWLTLLAIVNRVRRKGVRNSKSSMIY